ncbi:MAG: nucleotide pyrophosphatase, partial [Candidatus Krumholzibacteria bacterium]|nr:nucleotide pyrophosphatase [Candidatus Krumholzibacteria bacterium]
RYDPSTGEVVSFEEMVGAHGGLGGPQTDAFIVHPSDWPLPEGRIDNPEVLFRVFTNWRDALQRGEEPSGGRVDALPRDAL